MMQRHLIFWITAVGIIGIVFGLFYAVFGLEGLPVYQKFVSVGSFRGWSNGLYGAVFIGFSVLLLLIGRRAIQTKDRKLGKLLLFGIGTWLVCEVLVSIIYGVYINVLVDIVLLIFIGYPLLIVTKK